MPKNVSHNHTGLVIIDKSGCPGAMTIADCDEVRGPLLPLLGFRVVTELATEVWDSRH